MNLNGLLVCIPAYSYSEEYDDVMLASLKNQNNDNFSLLFIDPFIMGKRKDKIYNFEKETGIQSFYFPYQRDFRPRHYDWGIMNVPFILWENGRVFRYQQNRLISDTLIQEINNTKNINIGLKRKITYDINFPPMNDCNFHITISEADHRIDYFVNYFKDLSCFKPMNISWQKSDDPSSSYGDWIINIEDFLAINGVDEAMTTIHHFEDIDFNMRWNIAKRSGKVRGFDIVNGLMIYMDGSHRSQSKTIAKSSFNKECFACSGSNYHWDDLVNKSNDTNFSEINYLGLINGKEWFSCKECGIVFPRIGHSHFSAIEDRVHRDKNYYATIGVNGYGRNLISIRNDVLNATWDDKVSIINNSWGNPKYYV